VRMPAPPADVPVDWYRLEYDLLRVLPRLDAAIKVSVEVAQAADVCGDGVCGLSETGLGASTATATQSSQRCDADCPLITFCPGSLQTIVGQQAGQPADDSQLVVPLYDERASQRFPSVCSGFGSCDFRAGTCQCNMGALTRLISHADHSD
jgi:hypothetical protein